MTNKINLGKRLKKYYPVGFLFILVFIFSFIIVNKTDAKDIIIGTTTDNVGIGIATPGPYRLNINGDTNITGALNITGTISGANLNGALSAGNISSGSFGSNTGWGNYAFPGDLDVAGTVYAGELWTRDNVYLGYMGNWLSNLLNQSVRSDAGPTFQENYVNGWFRNNAAGNGLYNQATQSHFYSSSAGVWNIAGGAAYPQLIFRDNYGSTIRGYVYSDSSGFGLLNSNGGWSFRTSPASDTVYMPGSVGIGVENPGSKLLVVNNAGATSQGAALRVVHTDTTNGNFIPVSFESDNGTHSWGNIARFRVNGTISDRPSVQFSWGGSDTRWNVGFVSGSDDNFRISQNVGYRNDNVTSDSWGTPRLTIDTSGNVSIGGTVTAGALSGQLSGSINAANVTSGTFGANYGGGNYAFPVDRVAINGSPFTSGSAFGFGNGAAWPNQNSLAVDTLETDGGVGGGGTLELNYYGGNYVDIGPSGTKPLRASIMYDGNNTGYYIDPASTSNLNAANFAGNVTAPNLPTRQDGNRYSTDFNSILSSGFYNGEGTPANSPVNYGQLIVAKGSDTGLQIAGGYSNDNLYFRGWGYGPNGGFYPWRTVISDANIGSQSVSYANNSNTATYANTSGYATTATYANTSGSAGILTGSAHTNGSDGWFRSNGTAGWYSESYGVGIYATTAGRVDLYNGASLYVPGSVGIGTTNSSYKLQVIGNANITGSVTAGSFSGPMSGSLNAANVSSGTFGSNVGGGPYAFSGATSFTGDMTLPGVGTNQIQYGTGDAASSATYNFALRGWYGMALKDHTNTVRGYYNFRTGDLTLPAGTVTAAQFSGGGSGLTSVNADMVDGHHFNWSGQSGQPTWMWGGNDSTNMYVYNPSNFSVNYANSAGSVSSLAGTWWGVNYFGSNKGASSYLAANNTYGLEAYSTDGGAAAMSFHRAGYYAVNFGLDPDNVMRIGGWSVGNNNLWALDMSGNQTVMGQMRASAGANFYGNGYSFIGPGDTDGGMFSPADGTLVFATNNAERVRITPGGYVGIGTTAPDYKISVVNGGDPYSKIGLDPATQYFGKVQFGTAGSYIGYDYLGNERMVLNSRYSNSHYEFQINGAEKVRIDSAGNVGIGKTNPGSALDVVGGGQFAADGVGADTASYGTFGVTRAASSNPLSYIAMTKSGTTVRAMGIDGSNNWIFGAPTSGTQYISNVFLTIDPSGNATFKGGVTATNFQYYSDRNLKKNIEVIKDPLAKILQLEGVTFNWKKDNSPSVGVIAQDVEKVFPELVQDNNGVKTVQYSNLVAPLIEAVKAQQQEIESLNSRIKVLEAK